MALESQLIKALDQARQHLIANDVVFTPGLTDVEFNEIEEQFAFRFPPDLRLFLTIGVPIGNRFPNWRRRDSKLMDQMTWPLEGVFFDVKNRVFWYPGWGERPSSPEDAVLVAMQMCKNLSPMIPVFGHSYLPSSPCQSGNPVFSIHQADVIHRGANLAEYLLWIYHEDTDEIKKNYPVFSHDYTEVEFWTDVARQNST